MGEYHDTRFTFDQRRELLWKTLYDAYFRKLIGHDDCVLELGAGYGHFINQVRCRRRIALDQWAGFVKHVEPSVETRVAKADDLSFLDNSSVDFAFASNLFEHLTQTELATVLSQLKRILRPRGTLNILQPNYKVAYREYFDDYTHVSIYSDVSLCDFLAANGFRVIECKPRFLPLTIKSRMPVFPALIRLYLALPVKPLGKQMLIRAVAEADPV
jgi:SAM-dependent methyltransferase